MPIPGQGIGTGQRVSSGNAEQVQSHRLVNIETDEPLPEVPAFNQFLNEAYARADERVASYEKKVQILASGVDEINQDLEQNAARLDSASESVHAVNRLLEDLIAQRTDNVNSSSSGTFHMDDES
jgi:hypothetical protein